MKIDYDDLISGEKITTLDKNSVYLGIYFDVPVAIKIFDKKDLREERHKLLGYGIDNECLTEYNNLLEARARSHELSAFLQEPIGITKNPGGLHILVTKLITDSNGEISQDFKKCKEKINKDFISELRNVLYHLGENKVYHMDINNGDNLLVQMNSGVHPVLIDFLNMNFTYYPWLKLTKYLGIDSAEKRYYRRVNRFLNSLERLNHN